MRRHEKGQSLIFLAIGFLGLIAFIGITADVAILFARYSQLSRAVDSAAIAAANQMREDREYPHVRLAATQFIEFYGLDPELVDVQYCDTLPEAMRTGPDRDELCTDDQRKLVRVTAQINVDTIFGGILPFWPDRIELQASSVSETAALDVVIIMDVSESMLRYTSYEDWASSEISKGVIYRPPTIDEIAAAYTTPINPVTPADIRENGFGASAGLLSLPQSRVNDYLSYVGDGIVEPGIIANFTVQVDTEYFQNLTGNPQYQPREACRVRWFPGSYYTSVSSYVGYYDDATSAYVGLDDLYTEASGITSMPTTSFRGFVPTYNFYDCCNDPLVAGEPNNLPGFGNLICQPFKQARDATEQFLERIDFARGDRVGFVTFDRSAFLINPYGVPVVSGTPDPDSRLSPMIENLDDATAVVQQLLGVRAEPNFYVYNNSGQYNPATQDEFVGYWSGLAAGIDSSGASIPFDPGKVSYNPDDATVPEAYNYPVRNNCPFQNAGLPGTYSLFDASLLKITNPLDSSWDSYVDPTDGSAYIQGTTPRNANIAMSYEFWSSCRGTNIGAGLRVANNALLDPRTIREDGVWIMVLLSDGGAGASDAVRRNGDKLIPADPYFDTNPDPAIEEFGIPGDYGAFGVCPNGTPTNPAELMTPGDDIPFATFPHCSDEDWWTRHRCDFRPLRIALFDEEDAMQDNDYVTYGTFPGPPSAEEELSWNLERNNLYDVDIGQPGTQCDVNYYDVDDYARDWADFISLQQIAGTDEAVLPTIFTIGFGLEFPERTTETGVVLDITRQDDSVRICDLNPADCLGEQLLRYIADVGDNNFIDNDYYQDLMFFDGTGEYAGQLYVTNNWDGVVGDDRGYGDRGPCQTDYVAVGGDYDIDRDGFFETSEQRIQREMLLPQVSCGNYYFAPDGNQLRFVFDDIASRMYTRLAR
ncbi:MAG: hypothetical protein KC546_10145 [Anaerolineae bacterium]|nr:hypothetical protein [Anaerolineae bacterium]MCA9893831.1 hypothetical protein [Anaerolineae bacterium]